MRCWPTARRSNRCWATIPRFRCNEVAFQRLPRAGWAIGMAVRKDDVDAGAPAQAAVNDMKASGELQAIFARYGVQVVRCRDPRRLAAAGWHAWRRSWRRRRGRAGAAPAISDAGDASCRVIGSAPLPGLGVDRDRCHTRCRRANAADVGAGAGRQPERLHGAQPDRRRTSTRFPAARSRTISPIAAFALRRCWGRRRHFRLP